MEVPTLNMELPHSCTRSRQAPETPKPPTTTPYPTSLPAASPMQNAQGMKLQIKNIPICGSSMW